VNPYPILESKVLFRPPSNELRFLPEGPRSCGPGLVSWVAIQHGPQSVSGSLNILDVASGKNQNFPLPRRAGFAFPTNCDGVFLIGMERQLTLFNIASNKTEPLATPVEQGVTGTIINDAEMFPAGIVFGAKDLKFAEAKAGLYLFRLRDRRVIRLRDDQVCSNGKVITRNDDDSYRVLDIDTPKKTVVEYRLDVDKAKLDFVRVALDLNRYDSFPDGMIGTPDGRGVIIAFYNPGDSVCGEARHYDLATGDIVGVWTTPDSPQVTCPQLIEQGDGVKLILTTAVEHMDAARQQKYPNAGCLFIADTGFTSLPQPRRVELQ